MKITDHIPTARVYDEGSVGRIGSLMLNVQELQEPVFYAVSLSPMSAEKVRELINGGKRRWWYRNIIHICV